VSRDNVELVRRQYELINSLGRTEGFVDPEELAPDLWERFDPELELHERPDLPDRKVYRGRDTAKEFWRKTQDLFAEIRWEPLEIVDLGHAVVAHTRIVAVGRGSNVRIEADETDVWWFHDGRVVRLAGFPTRAEGLAAVQRPERD
jgi:ketosteroid isomerase-like protein